jgi:hypothetical protein
MFAILTRPIAYRAESNDSNSVAARNRRSGQNKIPLTRAHPKIGGEPIQTLKRQQCFVLRRDELHQEDATIEALSCKAGQLIVQCCSDALVSDAIHHDGPATAWSAPPSTCNSSQISPIQTGKELASQDGCKSLNHNIEILGWGIDQHISPEVRACLGELLLECLIGDDGAARGAECLQAFGQSLRVLKPRSVVQDHQLDVLPLIENMTRYCEGRQRASNGLDNDALDGCSDLHELAWSELDDPVGTSRSAPAAEANGRHHRLSCGLAGRPGQEMAHHVHHSVFVMWR